MRFRRRFHSRRLARRKVAWAHQVVDLTSASGVQSVDLLTNFKTVAGLTANPLGITIKRIRISIQIDFDLSVNALNRDSGMFVSTVVETGGLASSAVPAPVSNPDKDFNTRVWIPASGGTGMPTVPAAHLFVSRELDTKSMRKLHDIGDTMYVAFVPTGGASCAIGAQISTLLLLP